MTMTAFFTFSIRKTFIFIARKGINMKLFVALALFGLIFLVTAQGKILYTYFHSFKILILRIF